MIIRENKIRTSSKEVKLAVSYGIPDVKRWVRMFVEAYTINNDPDLIMRLKNQTISEAEFRHFIECSPLIIGWVESPWRTQLSAWAWYQVIQEGFVIPSSTKENGFILTEKAFIRTGRPKGS